MPLRQASRPTEHHRSNEKPRPDPAGLFHGRTIRLRGSMAAVVWRVAAGGAPPRRTAARPEQDKITVSAETGHRRRGWWVAMGSDAARMGPRGRRQAFSPPSAEAAAPTTAPNPAPVGHLQACPADNKEGRGFPAPHAETPRLARRSGPLRRESSRRTFDVVIDPPPRRQVLHHRQRQGGRADHRLDGQLRFLQIHHQSLVARDFRVVEHHRGGQ
ncbi:hypothetical protein OTERR_13590 [Oryzomicrobium terrae]|uniref:Uncharacterized protein n=1 Tax=Oryzomicrobium terrae TaxID=1735038 RepID=A0A5C1E884_9RHOO|nr:hypothetical protein OTERR_13590 [Oryzomicrobium terrae]